MKVTSPIGEMPFKAGRARVSRKGIVIEGSMGAWPAKVTVSASDAPQILRIAAIPLLVVAAIVVAIIAAVMAIN